MAGVNELSHSLIQKQRCQLNAANLDAGFLLMLYYKFQAPAHSCDCHSGTSRQHPQDGKSLPKRISMGLHCAGSLKFSLLEPNRTSEVKHRSTGALCCQVGRWLRHKQGEGRDLTESWTQQEKLFTLLLGFPNSGRCELHSPGKRVGWCHFLPLPSPQADFIEAHSAQSGDLSCLHQALPCCALQVPFFFF